MHPNLSFDQAPPITVPLRFFLTAPVFGVFAGLLLMVVGGDALVSRWVPATLALVHLITAGFLLQAMCGALLQLVPVVTGANMWRPRWVATLVHPLLVLAACQLVGGFLFSQQMLWMGAAACFVVAVTSFVLPLGFALWRTPARGSSVFALRLAVLGLLVTVGLGAALAEGLARGRSLPFASLTDIHLTWGLAAWALGLVVGVSYLVVPMFQLTPAYPTLVKRATVPLLFAAAVILSLFSGAVATVGYAALIGAVVTFAITTLSLQRRRKRRVVDSTFRLFRIAMLSFVMAAALGIVAAIWPAMREDPRIPLVFGVLVLQGGFLSVVAGMLYKIVPFLVWLHLQRLGAPLSQIPSMKTLIAEATMSRQMYAHLAALVLMLVAVFWPSLARVAGLALVISFAWLEINLLGAARRYRSVRSRILASGPGYGS